MQAVLLEEDTLVLSRLRAIVSADGEQGENMIREGKAGFTVALRRPVRDLLKQLPNIEVPKWLPYPAETAAQIQDAFAGSLAYANCHHL